MENRPGAGKALPESDPPGGPHGELPGQPRGGLPARDAVNTDDWSMPQPEVLPRPTFAPAGVAFGAAFLLWGLLTSYLVSIVGAVVFAASLALWIRELVREGKHERIE